MIAMSELVIEINRLGKMYRLYRRPADKVFDAFGLSRWMFWRKNYFQEFWALRNLNLKVRRGERVGIIGRNGAGKSTLLKIITGNIAPSEGKAAVNGRIQALLELGTGFHPEFTGRDNIRASLAYQNVSSAMVREKEEEIIDFSELDEFIDQPVKTYSAGMYARLAFSTATAIEPEVLIIDEVLGAGDAYFAAKCVERMRSLTEGCNATVLFVSHDLGSVQQLCERVIWIDRGRVVMDGSPVDVTKAYYASILAQEELRIRARNARLGQKQARQLEAREADEDVKELLFRLVTATGEPPTESHPIKRLTLCNGNGVIAGISPGGPMDNDASDTAYLLTDPKYMLWRDPEFVGEDVIRCFAATGGKYGHAPFVMEVAREVWQAGGLELEIEHAAVPGDSVRAELFDGSGYHLVGVLTPGRGGWRVERWSLPAAVTGEQACKEADGVSEVDGSETAETDAVDAVDEAVEEESVADIPAEEAAVVCDEPIEAEERSVMPQSEVHAGQQRNAMSVAGRGWDGVGEVVLKQRSVDRFYSDYAEFADIRVLDGKNQPKEIFAVGEPIRIGVTAVVTLPIPVCEFSFAIYTLRNLVISVGHWPIAGGLAPGRHEWTITIDRPNIRQDEYLVSGALIREFFESDNECFTFYAVWNRSPSFRINEGRMGRTPLGTVLLPLDPPDGEKLTVRSLAST